MHKEIDIKKWEDYKTSSKVLHIKSFKQLDTSWDSIIDLANRSLHTASDTYAEVNKNYPEDKYVYQNDVASILRTIGYVQFISQMPLIAKEIDQSVKEIDKVFGSEVERTSVQFFCNLFATEYVSEVHSDPWDAVVLQIKGTTIWDMYTEDKNNIVDSIALEQGDLLLVPTGAVHRVTSNSSRATLNFPIHTEKRK
jgi:mannose-6-phosphate isomerase-like protein (cupin superfamily)